MYIAKYCFCNTTYHNTKETIDNMSTNGQTDGHRQFRVLLFLNFANQYALLWIPNAYRDILMRIFTPCLFFQCVFTNFQCVITLLRALSVIVMSQHVQYNCIVLTKIFHFPRQPYSDFYGTAHSLYLYSIVLFFNSQSLKSYFPIVFTIYIYQSDRYATACSQYLYSVDQSFPFPPAPQVMFFEL